jgi:hypothetical protein
VVVWRAHLPLVSKFICDFISFPFLTSLLHSPICCHWFLDVLYNFLAMNSTLHELKNIFQIQNHLKINQDNILFSKIATHEA